jgi:hypothetical protein
LSDCFKYEIIDDFVYKVECHNVKIGATKIDIGANKSAEADCEDEEADEEQERTEIDLVNAFKLQQVPEFDKKAFLAQFKGYAQELQEKIPEEKYKKFQQNATPYFKSLIQRWNPKNLQFYVGENYNGMTILMEFEENGSIYAYYYIDGMKGEKF